MDYIYLFDVDGTLTPPRKPMTPSFAQFFEKFVAENKVYLVSGSNYDMIAEQVPGKLLQLCAGVYGSSGSEYFEQGRPVRQRQHRFDGRLILTCEDFVSQSDYPHKVGNHLDYRPGMINVSSLGRNATTGQRSAYYQWDAKTMEREIFARQINREFSTYEASLGGQISVDIVPAGWNKSTVKDEILAKHPNACLCFFGDRMEPGGNDHPLAEALKFPPGIHKSVAVPSYLETKKALKRLMPGS